MAILQRRRHRQQQEEQQSILFHTIFTTRYYSNVYYYGLPILFLLVALKLWLCYDSTSRSNHALQQFSVASATMKDNRHHHNNNIENNNTNDNDYYPFWMHHYYNTNDNQEEFKDDEESSTTTTHDDTANSSSSSSSSIEPTYIQLCRAIIATKTTTTTTTTSNNTTIIIIRENSAVCNDQNHSIQSIFTIVTSALIAYMAQQQQQQPAIIIIYDHSCGTHYFVRNNNNSTIQQFFPPSFDFSSFFLSHFDDNNVDTRRTITQSILNGCNQCIVEYDGGNDDSYNNNKKGNDVNNIMDHYFPSCLLSSTWERPTTARMSNNNNNNNTKTSTVRTFHPPRSTKMAYMNTITYKNTNVASSGATPVMIPLMKALLPTIQKALQEAAQEYRRWIQFLSNKNSNRNDDYNKTSNSHFLSSLLLSWDNDNNNTTVDDDDDGTVIYLDCSNDDNIHAWVVPFYVYAYSIPRSTSHVQIIVLQSCMDHIPEYGYYTQELYAFLKESWMPETPMDLEVIHDNNSNDAMLTLFTRFLLSSTTTWIVVPTLTTTTTTTAPAFLPLLLLQATSNYDPHHDDGSCITSAVNSRSSTTTTAGMLTFGHHVLQEHNNNDDLLLYGPLDVQELFDPNKVLCYHNNNHHYDNLKLSPSSTAAVMKVPLLRLEKDASSSSLETITGLYNTTNTHDDNGHYHHPNMTTQEQQKKLKTFVYQQPHHPAINTLICPKIRGKVGTWKQDIHGYAPLAQYNGSPVRRYGLQQEHFQPTQEQPYRSSTTYKWEDLFCPMMDIVVDPHHDETIVKNHTTSIIATATAASASGTTTTSFSSSASSSSLMTLQGLCHTLYDLNIRRIFFVGDSLSNQVAVSFYKLLGFQDEPKDYNTNFGHWEKTVQCDDDASFFSFEIRYVRNDKLSDSTWKSTWTNFRFNPRQRTFLRFTNCQDGKCFPWVQEYLNNVEERTLLIVNTGAHTHDLESFQQDAHTFLQTIDNLFMERKRQRRRERNKRIQKWLSLSMSWWKTENQDETMKDHARITTNHLDNSENDDDDNDDIVIFRTTVPGHRDCMIHGIQPYKNYSEYAKAPTTRYDWNLMTKHNAYFMKLVESRNRYYWQEGNANHNKMIKREENLVRSNDDDDESATPPPAPIEILDVYPMTILRPDGHAGADCPGCRYLGKKLKADCLHYAMPGPMDWWNHVLYNNLKDWAQTRKMKKQEIKTP